MNAKATYSEWVQKASNAELREELTAILSNKLEIEERFYQYINFGTAGMRGLLGAGTNRINIYTIRRVAEGLARYVSQQGIEAKERGVVIAFDTRHFSYEFASETASVLGAHGIRIYIYKEARPTPQLSFTVRKLNAFAGVVITASHNPKEYNGFKVYGEDGAQLLSTGISAILKNIDDIEDIFSIKLAEVELLKEQGLLQWLAGELDSAYMDKLVTLKDTNHKKMDMKIVYTSLHGSGLIPIREGLRVFGFTNVTIVEEQAVQDGAFPTVPYPNPEEAAAFSFAIRLGKSINAEILLATDPDADRLGVGVRDGLGYQLLTGNQIAALLLDYLLLTKEKSELLPSNGKIVKTIVTSEIGVKIAEKYGVAVDNTLTGFKYIAEKIAEYEKTGEHTYLFGYEESYGYLIGTFSRDKDAVQIALKVAEMAAYYAGKGYTLLDKLEHLYEEFGYFQETLVSLVFNGKNGKLEMMKVLQHLRADMPKEIAAQAVTHVEDYLIGKAQFSNGRTVELSLPKENVLKFFLEDGTWIAVRPSGTEPKCKFYIGVVDTNMEAAQQKLEQMKKAVLGIVERAKSDEYSHTK